jgi:hypothetical protein
MTKQTISDDLALLVRMLVYLSILTLSLTLIYQFWHGYSHGVVHTEKNTELAQLCKESAAMREKYTHDCEHYASVGQFGPVEDGLKSVGSFLVDAFQSLSALILGASLVLFLITYCCIGAFSKQMASVQYHQSKLEMGAPPSTFSIEEVPRETSPPSRRSFSIEH